MGVPSAYVGFGKQSPQGGVNTEGLAYDWVAGYQEKWDRDPKAKMNGVTRNPSGQMLESCATVEEAVAFFRNHWVPHFSYAKIMVADRTGASAIMGAKDGQLDVQILKQSRGFDYGGEIVKERLAENLAPTLANAANILRAAKQEGQYATKYSNVFDLRSGDIFLFRFPEHPEAVKLNLVEELKRGRHSFNIPGIEKQLGPRPQ